MKVIDVHAHLVQYICGMGEEGGLRSIGGGKAVYDSGSIVQMIPETFRSDCVTAEMLLETMDRNNVEKAVLLQGNYYGFQNHYTMEAIRKYPARFTGAASYDPFHPGKERIREHLFEELGFRIEKWELSSGSGLMGTHPSLRLDEEVMDEAFHYASEMRHILVVDIGKCGSRSWQVEALGREIRKYPDTNFVLCHLLAPNEREQDRWMRAMELLSGENVFYDLSSLVHNTRAAADPLQCSTEYILKAIGIAGADRLLFGTDYPSCLKAHSYADYISYIADCPLFSGEQKEKILYRNAEGLFFKDAF